jgi:3D-(3,5/4)-trihydroxycyclohexane-1,2-dione acylhydrolase (decyclizing)
VPTAVAERIELVIVLVQNHGRASIGALSRSVGGAGYGTHYRVAANGDVPVDDGRSHDPVPVDLAANAESLGARAVCADDRGAARGARRGQGSPGRAGRVHVETDRYAGVPSCESWWEVPVARGRRRRGRALRARRVRGGAQEAAGVHKEGLSLFR